MINIVDVLAFSIVVNIIATMLVVHEGPYKVFLRFREYTLYKHFGNKHWHNISDLLDCVTCTSTYVAIPFSIAYVILNNVNWFWVLFYVFLFTGISRIIDEIMSKIETEETEE